MKKTLNVLQFVHFPRGSVGLGAGITNRELSKVDTWLATNRLFIEYLIIHQRVINRD